MSWSIVLFVCMLVGSIALMILPAKTHTLYLEDFVEGLIAIGLFGFLCFRSIYYALAFPKSNISMDKEGLWPTHMPKNGSLIYWSDIAGYETGSPLMKRLHLLDHYDHRLMTIHYHIDRYDELVEEIQRRTRLDIVK